MNNQQMHNYINTVLGAKYAAFSPKRENYVTWPRVFFVEYERIDI
jgi:hypothetical protein